VGVGVGDGVGVAVGFTDVLGIGLGVGVGVGAAGATVFAVPPGPLHPAIVANAASTVMAPIRWTRKRN
jgi:hypothetical protein